MMLPSNGILECRCCFYSGNNATIDGILDKPYFLIDDMLKYMLSFKLHCFVLTRLVESALAVTRRREREGDSS